MENDVKNSYREIPGKGILGKWSKNAFFSPGTLPKKMKNVHFSGPFFAKARLGFHFLFIFLSFSVSILRKMETKWNVKMSEKLTENANCERP